MNDAAMTVDPASFRDPHGRVVHLEGRVFRVLTASGAGAWQHAALAAAELAADGLMVRATELTDAPALSAIKAAFADAALVLEHEPLPLISYPAEWTAAMLADAGLLTLEIQRRLTHHGLSLQDATAYNIAFRDGQPVFIDAGSIVRPARLDIWYALGQFHRMFLYPLMLAQRGFTPGELFPAHMDGITPRHMARAFGRFGWLRPGRLFSVYLPAWLEGRKSSGSVRTESMNPTGNPAVQRAILSSNRRRLERLRRKLRPRGAWVGYRDSNTYTEESEQKKQTQVSAFVQGLNSAALLDLGANTGVYSRIMAKHGKVIAVDADHDALDAFYREARSDKLAGVDFVCTNLANPAPGIGFMNAERSPFLQRVKADGAVALALVHHLLVTAGLTLPQVAQLLASFAPHLLVEYVAPLDPMFRHLVSGRVDLWQALDEPAFVSAFADFGMKLCGRSVLSPTRTLMEFRNGG